MYCSMQHKMYTIHNVKKMEHLKGTTVKLTIKILCNCKNIMHNRPVARNYNRGCFCTEKYNTFNKFFKQNREVYETCGLYI